VFQKRRRTFLGHTVAALKKANVIAGIAAVMLTAIPATTGALYVSTTGSDTANGSFTTPFRTIGKGISVLAGGGTLYVRGGTYNESPYINRPSGTAATPTVISAYQGETVTLQGPGVNTSRVKIIGVHYLNFEGFTITNYNQGLYVNTSDHINVRNVTIHDVGQEAMTIHLDSSYVTVENCLIHDTRKWQYNGEGIYVGTGAAGPLDNTNNVTIRGCTIYNTTDEGIELKPGTHDCTVEGNTLYRVNLWPLSYSGFIKKCFRTLRWITRIGSDWSQNNYPYMGGIEVDQSVAGQQHWNSNPNHKIYSNIIHDCTTAISMRTGGEVAFNTISAVGTYGVYISNPNNDPYVRYIWGNDITAPTPIFRNGGTVSRLPKMREWDGVAW
jgi:parallel beta-helix repeat protein